VEGVPIIGLQVGFNAKATLASMDLTMARFPVTQNGFLTG
jgi:hypothetical protein